MAGEEACRRVVEEIRATKFGADNPLAPDMHQAIRHLAAELYQKDLHFVMELVQNADDNTYPDGIVPELAFVLVEADVASVGVQWTLLVLNNEVGFSVDNIHSLCSIGRSTKAGKRDSGYIGEKGIGFKSVFLVTRQPLVISNGFRIRFDEAPSVGKELGYIVPEWVEEPTDAHLLDCLRIHELPNTIIVLPIRPEKVQAMREQLFQLSPQLVLFLRKIEKLSVCERTNPPRKMSVQRYTIPTPPQFAIPNSCKYSLVRLSSAHKEASYLIWHQEFPVQLSHEVDHRRDVQTWIVTLAFPIQNDRSAADAVQPDIYAFLPTKLRAGFPFLINGDFLLVSSRETIRFDSEWNKGILTCIPQAFMDAFLFFLEAAVDPSSAPFTQLQRVYSYVPYGELSVRELGFVRGAIMEHMRTHDIILCDANMGQQFPSMGAMSPSSSIGTSPPFFCRPSMACLINPEFRQVLEEAHKANVRPPNLLTSQRVYVVDAETANEHQAMLRALKVRVWAEEDYIKCLRSSVWLKSLSEPLYVKLLDFLSKFVASKALYADVPLVKYLDAEGEMRMLAAQDKNSISIYMSKKSMDEHFLSKWRPIFQRWVSVHFIPRKTVRVIHELLGTRVQSICKWLHDVFNVAELSVHSYGDSLARRCEKMPFETDLALGVMHFFLHATQDGYVDLRDCQSIIQKLPLIDRSGKAVRGFLNHVLLPASVCTWPRVLLHDSWKNHVLCLSEKYLELPLPISDEIGGPSSVLGFLKKAVNAVDIFDITNPPNAHFYTDAPWGQRADDVKSFLAWIKDLEYIPDQLKVSLQGSDWVETVDHGKKKPARCFLDSGHWYPTLHKGDVPFMDLGFYGDLQKYSSILHVLGVAVDIRDGASAVAEHVCEVSKAGCSEVQTDRAIRWYTYLRMQNWVGWATQSSQSQKLIWVPGCSDRGSCSLGSWRSSQECVLSDSGGLFTDRLIVLNRYYKNQDVLMFFEHNMGVASTPGPEKYCRLWVDWGENRREISKEACESAWRIIAQGWTLCARSNSCEVQRFKTRCRIPCARSSTMDVDEVKLAPPEEVLYADNLALAEVFDKADPGPLFAWYPRSASAAPWVEDLVRCYTDLGVKMLSGALEGGSSAGYSSKIGISQASGSGICRGRVGRGVFRAILGYLAEVKHGILAPVRKRMVMQLQNVKVWQVDRVGEVKKYRVTVGGCVYEAIRRAHVRWEKGEKRIYMAMPSGSNKVMVAHELAVEVVKGVLGGERVALAHGLQELLLVAAGFGFDDDAVKELLCLRNLRLNLEDEALLMDIPGPSFKVDCLSY